MRCQAYLIEAGRIFTRFDGQKAADTDHMFCGNCFRCIVLWPGKLLSQSFHHTAFYFIMVSIQYLIPGYSSVDFEYANGHQTALVGRFNNDFDRIIVLQRRSTANGPIERHCQLLAKYYILGHIFGFRHWRMQVVYFITI